MRRRRRQRFQRLHYHPLNVFIPDAPRCAGPRRVQQPVAAGLHETAPPFADGLARRTQVARHGATSPSPADRVVPLSLEMVGLRFAAAANAAAVEPRG